MKRSDASQDQSPSQLISKRIAELGDWRGETLSRMRKLIKEADADVVEEWKWMAARRRLFTTQWRPESCSRSAGWPRIEYCGSSDATL